MATFNPYKEAAGDAAMQRNATRRWWNGWCRKCNTEKPLKGGKTQDKVKGSAFSGRSGGVVQRFVCADCLAKMGETPNVGIEPPYSVGSNDGLGPVLPEHTNG